MTDKIALGVIPARYNSQRFPGKPLIDILNKPMIQWVYERAQQAQQLSELVVATDDERIFAAVQKFGGRVEMTPISIKNGSERVAFVARKYDYPIVVNIQGDEPLIDPAAIDVAVELLLNDKTAPVGTLVKKIEDSAELHNPNLPKVVVDKNGFALYFSRAAIPYWRDSDRRADWANHHKYLRHVGLYVYRKEFLQEYTKLPESNLEKIEKLEQLRILEHGYRIKVAEVNYAPQGIDTPGDLESLLRFLRENPIE